MGLAPARKQNSSCDPCRRSKRRCILPEDEAGHVGGDCMNCVHLGHKCTWDFVNSRLNQKRDKARQSSLQTSQQPIAPASSQPPIGNVAPLHPNPVQAASRPSTAHEAIRTSGLPPGLPDEDMLMSGLLPNWASFDSTLFCTAPPSHATDLDSGSPLTNNVKRQVSSPSASHRLKESISSPTAQNSSIGLWRGSPIHLLNSSIEKQRVNENLGEIYNSMMAGIAIRYLDYKSNLFAPSYRYSFDPEETKVPSPGNPKITNDRVVPTFTASWKRGRPEDNSELQFLTPETLSTQINNVTMIGVARFLDNFGSLYGNNISHAQRIQNDNTLTAVMQAFALQYAPSRLGEQPLAQLYGTQEKPPGSKEGTNSMEIFTSAWYSAHSQLIKSKTSRSFVKLYAIFLFRMTSVPPQAESITPYENTSLGLLDETLWDLDKLQSMIKRYCERLHNQSIYRFLLLSSASIMRWFGYLRDTIDSITNERPCVLEDAPLTTDGSLLSGHSPVPVWVQSDEFDHQVPRNCQTAAGDLFRVFRAVIHLRQAVLHDPAKSDPGTVRDKTNFAIGVFDEFSLIYDQWLHQCIISFYLLSDKSKIASAFMVLFWHGSILMLVEQIHHASNVFTMEEASPLLEKAQEYQRTAVASLHTIAQRIVDVSNFGEFQLINSIQARLDFISHHANTALVVFTLSKAIEHTIDLHLSSNSLVVESVNTSPNGTSDWIATMKPLLTCLLTLDATVTGTITARPALQRLMHQYGDILMDCWTFEDVEAIT